VDKPTRIHSILKAFPQAGVNNPSPLGVKLIGDAQANFSSRYSD
jgi:hypothetical protein